MSCPESMTLESRKIYMYTFKVVFVVKNTIIRSVSINYNELPYNLHQVKNIQLVVIEH